MYSNNDFRLYKNDNYLAHYGKKGMKWHKHLKAATDWWKYDVTGSGYKRDADLASSRSDQAHEMSQGHFTTYQKTGQKGELDSAAKLANRAIYHRKQEKWNKEQYQKKRDVAGRLKNAVTDKSRKAKMMIDSRVTGSTARKVAAREDRQYKELAKSANKETGYARARARAYRNSERPDFVTRDMHENRYRASKYNQEAVKHLNKRNRAQEEYEKSLRGKAEKRLNSIFKKRKKK